MIGPKTARNGAVLLATGIAETLEDNAHVAARFNAAPDPAAAGTRLYLAAEDIMALAAALRVLTRPLPEIDDAVKRPKRKSSRSSSDRPSKGDHFPADLKPGGNGRLPALTPNLPCSPLT